MKYNITLLAKIFFFVMISYGFFLYFKINFLINKKMRLFPVFIYSKVITLQPGNSYSQKEIISMLRNIQYKYVSVLRSSGEFITEGKNVILIRRSFDFPDGREEKICVKLFFNGNKLIKIKNLYNNRNFSFLRLDPKLIMILRSLNGEQMLVLPKKCYPSELINMLLTVEDRYFYIHHGINVYSIIRAFLINIRSGYIVQGGSTLTQQLVKNLFLTNTKTLWRKIKEIYMALVVDWKFSKDKILEVYLNEVYFGQDRNKQIRGFPLASLYYFGRSINELSLDQCALLVGMIKGASLYNPWKNPMIALNRRNEVLYILFKQCIINNKLYRSLISKPLIVKSRKNIVSDENSLVQIIQKELKRKLENKTENLLGIKVFTTLNLVSQAYLNHPIKIIINFLKK
ncbi:MAG: transglycosylase domain-containing protein [Buchnera aphidicola (Nurudea shiraii)]